MKNKARLCIGRHLLNLEKLVIFSKLNLGANDKGINYSYTCSFFNDTANNYLYKSYNTFRPGMLYSVSMTGKLISNYYDK